MKRMLQSVLGALLGAAIASCGGGGGGGNSVAEGGIGGTGISSGSISAFGSIVVNGTKFDVNAAPITVNGDPAAEDDLDIGYIVRVDGDLDDGVAEEVRFEASLIGEVDANKILSGETVGTLVVLQQEVEITPTTVLELKSVDGPDMITELQRVLVSGFRDSADRLIATHLELNPTETLDQIVGRVDVSNNMNFTINGLVIDSNSAPDVDDLVIVRGNYDPTIPVFDPTSPVEELEDLVGVGIEIELEGIVDRFVNESDFDVNGVTVDADAANAIIVDESGAPATFQQDSEVEVEGSFGSTGILVADRVEVELEDNVEIVARVANDPAAGDPVQFFNANGTPELSVTVTEKTRLRDKSANPVENFSVADLAMGNWVELDAFEDGDGNVTALKIERFDPDTDEEDASVEGTVDEIPAGNILTILGIDFDTTGASFDDFGDLSEIDKDDVVEVEWTDTDPTGPATVTLPISVDEVELEEDN